MSLILLLVLLLLLLLLLSQILGVLSFLAFLLLLLLLLLLFQLLLIIKSLQMRKHNPASVTFSSLTRVLSNAIRRTLATLRKPQCPPSIFINQHPKA